MRHALVRCLNCPRPTSPRPPAALPPSGRPRCIAFNANSIGAARARKEHEVPPSVAVPRTHTSDDPPGVLPLTADAPAADAALSVVAVPGVLGSDFILAVVGWRVWSG